jgi:hypothetical protein
MHESPFLGWIIPNSWQEPEFHADSDDDEPQITDQLDDEGYLITQM